MEVLSGEKTSFDFVDGNPIQEKSIAQGINPATAVARVNALAKVVYQHGYIYKLWRPDSNNGGRQYIYALHLCGKWQDMEARAKEVKRRILEALLPTECFECWGRMMSIVGRDYRITYCVEGGGATRCGKHATHSVRFDGNDISVEPLGHMGMFECRRVMVEQRVSVESVRKHMSVTDFVKYFPNFTERYIAIYKWLTGKRVFKSDAARALELIARGEGEFIEFKAASAGVHDDVFETVCSFANGQGGDMFLGVNDHGQAVGLSREALDGIKRDVKQACSANGLFTKAVPVGVQQLVLNRHHIVHIQVPRMRGGIAYKGDRYVRRGDADFKV